MVFSVTHGTAQRGAADKDPPSGLALFWECLKESDLEFGQGLVDFFTIRRAAETQEISERINEGLRIESRIPKAASALFANITYFVATPFHDVGTAIGTGAAKVAPFVADRIPSWLAGALSSVMSDAMLNAITPSLHQSRNRFVVLEGLGELSLGAIGAVNLALGGIVGARTPIPPLKLPKLTWGGGGALTLSVVEVAVPGAQGGLVVGAAAAAGAPTSGLVTSQMGRKGEEGQPSQVDPEEAYRNRRAREIDDQEAFAKMVFKRNRSDRNFQEAYKRWCWENHFDPKDSRTKTYFVWSLEHAFDDMGKFDGVVADRVIVYLQRRIALETAEPPPLPPEMRAKLRFGVEQVLGVPFELFVQEAKNPGKRAERVLTFQRDIDALRRLQGLDPAKVDVPDSPPPGKPSGAN